MKNERKLAAHTSKARSSALRFLYIHTLRRLHMLEHIPISKTPVKLPKILSRGEIARLIDGSQQSDASRDSDDRLLDRDAPV